MFTFMVAREALRSDTYIGKLGAPWISLYTVRNSWG